MANSKNQSIIEKINNLRAKLGLDSRSSSESDDKFILSKECAVYAKLVNVRDYWVNCINTEDGRKEALFALQFFSLIPLPLWTADDSGSIQYWNEYAERAYSYKPEDVLGENFIPLFVNEPERAQARQDLSDIINGKEGLEHFNMADDIDNSGNTVRVLACCFAVFDERLGKVVQAEVSFDVSQLNHHEEELNKIQTNFQEQEKRRLQFLDKERDYLLDTLHAYYIQFLNRCEEKIALCVEIIDDPCTAKHALELQKKQRENCVNIKKNFVDWYLDMKTQLEHCLTSEGLHELRVKIDKQKEKNV